MKNLYILAAIWMLSLCLAILLTLLWFYVCLHWLGVTGILVPVGIFVYLTIVQIIKDNQ